MGWIRKIMGAIGSLGGGGDRYADWQRRAADYRVGQPGPRPAHGLNGGVAVVQPEDHRLEEEALGPESHGDGLGEFGEGQDAMASDEPLCLNGEGDEGRVGGRPCKLTDSDLETVRALLKSAEDVEAVARAGAG